MTTSLRSVLIHRGGLNQERRLEANLFGSNDPPRRSTIEAGGAASHSRQPSTDDGYFPSGNLATAWAREEDGKSYPLGDFPNQLSDSLVITKVHRISGSPQEFSGFEVYLLDLHKLQSSFVGLLLFSAV
jgi:hypothetical protein